MVDSADSTVDIFGDPIESKGKHYPMVVLTNKKLLMDEQFSDVTIGVGNEKVTGHSFIIACRCEELLMMPNEADKKKKKVKKDIKVKNIPSGMIMQRVLEYLYTGMVEFPKLQTMDILRLNAAARVFKLNRLGYLCERWLREHMSMDNVFHLLKGAVDAKEMRVKGFCLQYALDHYNDFIGNKDGIHILGIDLFQEVVAAFTNRPPPPEEIPPSKAPPDTLLDDFRRMYEKMPYSDVSFVVGGVTLKCHKAILAAHSDAFIPHIKDAGAQGVEFNQLSTEAFRAMLQFVYYGDDNIDPHPATELVAFCKSYKLHQLLKICEDKCRTSVSVDTVLDILATTYIKEVGEKAQLTDELRNKAFPFILANLTTIDLTPIRKMNPEIAIDILMKLQQSWGEAPPATNDYASAPPPPSREGGSSFMGTQRAQPPVPAAADEQPPPPPPRHGSVSNMAAVPQPPPRGGGPPPLATPPPPLAASNGGGAAPAPPPRDGDEPKSARKGGKDSKKSKKEEERKKKEEEKRVAREKKEREKAEKKFRGKKGKE